MYFTHMNLEKLSDITKSGVCVKACPDLTNIADQKWWTENCKNADAKTVCPTSTSTENNYASTNFGFLPYCIPSTDDAKFAAKVKDLK